jgi:hypothetical protein
MIVVGADAATIDETAESGNTSACDRAASCKIAVILRIRRSMVRQICGHVAAPGSVANERCRSEDRLTAVSQLAFT